jgi:hypothetical protein
VHKEEDMSDYNEQTLTEAVIKRVAATPDPRLRQILTSLVKHLHGCVREVRPTYERLVTQLFLKGDQCLDSDVVFAVKESLVVDPERVQSREEAAKYQVEAPFYRMHYDFVLKPAQA